MLTTVRVRGIFATALTILLRRKGFLIVDTSKVLQERLGIPQVNVPAMVTVKSTDERPDELLIFGYPKERAEEVLNSLLEELRFVSVRRSRYGNNTVVAAKTVLQDERCHITLPDGRNYVYPRELCGEDPITLLTIVHDPPPGRPSKPVIRKEVRAVGDYVIVSKPGDGVSFSEHIRDRDRMTELLLIAVETIDTKQFHVHFRSNSKSAPPEAIRQELIELTRKIEEVQSEKYDEPRVVLEGEFLALLYVPRPAKDYLDDLRASVYPTIKFHHTLKSFGNQESLLVDCAESSHKLYGEPQPKNGSIIMGFLVDKHPKRTVIIDHRRPDGSQIRLGPFSIESVIVEEDRVKLLLNRVFRQRGEYDALGVIKEPGDRGRSIVDTSKWYIIHEYISADGRLKGVYANINTPPEVGLGRVKYLDLYVDVVKRPGSPAEIVDIEELTSAYEAGNITRELYERAVEEAERLERKLNTEYP